MNEQQTGMDFSAALQAMRAGHLVQRINWPENRYIKIVSSRITNSELFFISDEQPFNYDDILATDWELAD